MKNILKNKKLVLIVGIISFIVIAGIGGTLAWYVWTTKNDDITKIATSVGVAKIIYDDGADIIGQEIFPVDDKANGIVKKIRVKAELNNPTDKVMFNLYLDIKSIDEELKHTSFKYALYKGNTSVKSGNFASAKVEECIKNSTSHIVLLKDQLVTDNNEVYFLYIWIDSNVENPYEMAGKNFEFTLHADGQNAIMVEAVTPDISEFASNTLAYNIVNTYNSANDKTTVVSGDVKYNYDTTNKLMSDIDGNVRYYGGTPNNYVYFNCNDYDNQSASTCEKWRIIGVVDGKVKIIRDSIGIYAWDYTSTYEYDNNWHDATVMALLNDGYYNNLDNVKTYYYSKSSYITNFATDGIGIKNEITRDMISESTWYLGNGYKAGNYVDAVYSGEKSGKFGANTSITWNGNIAIMNPSDYGYAADLSVCNYKLNEYNNEACTSNNWLYIGENEWLISPTSNASTTNVWTRHSDGHITNNTYPRGRRAIRPTLYLEDNIAAYDGDGSINNPYKIQFVNKDYLELGDYVYYEPVIESYDTLTDKTGYSDVQTIYPKELTLWRVLFINEDGTVDLVSEGGSRTKVYFSGLVGYQNIVGYLNVLASQYETEGITVGSRHFGYNGQTEYITDTSKFTETPPWACSTGGSCSPAPVESQGGGDELYTRDYYQAKTVKIITAYRLISASSPTDYWMASRLYSIPVSNHYWRVRHVSTSGGMVGTVIISLYSYYGSRFIENSSGSALRPVVTLSSELSYEGVGIKEAPMRIITG